MSARSAGRYWYAAKAIPQIARILSREDREPFSPTFGCFDRIFWHERAIDFPSAIAQFAVHALALAYAHPFPGSVYHKQAKVRDWVLAGVEYWTRIQKSDGSFDEFYPNERGWAGPTAFLLYAMLDSYRRLRSEFPRALEERFLTACHRAARYLARWDEAGVLANHYAIALTAIYEAYLVFEDRALKAGFETHLRTFRGHCATEGWSLEYDGADPGYLSGTVSFLGKLYKVYPDPEIREVARRAIEFSSHFAYPNGFYAGTIGSRQTLHFYPHGYEVFGPEMPLAQAVADRMIEGLAEGKLVPPEIMCERYFIYRVPEFLLAHLDYTPRPPELPALPWEGPDLARWFPEARIYVRKAGSAYLVANMAKGGVLKLFDVDSRRLILNDCGAMGQLDSGRVVTTQWISPTTRVVREGDSCRAEGRFVVVSYTHLTPLRMIMFRAVLLALGWHSGLARWLKGLIRTLAITKSRLAPLAFSREIRLLGERLEIVDSIRAADAGRAAFRRLRLGDESTPRYVPQSRYFQAQELDVEGLWVPDEPLRQLRERGHLTVRRVYVTGTGERLETRYE